MYIDLTTVVPQDSPQLQWAIQQENPYLAMGHVGTHLDTYEKRPIPPEYFKSQGILFDVRRRSEIFPADIPLEQIQSGDFVLFRTGWIEAHPYGNPEYFADHPQLSHALIQALAEKAIRFIGVDCPGIRQHSEHEPADRFCEKHGIYVIENLRDLSRLPTGQLTVYTIWQEDPNMTGLRCKVIAECFEPD